MARADAFSSLTCSGNPLSSNRAAPACRLCSVPDPSRILSPQSISAQVVSLTVWYNVTKHYSSASDQASPDQMLRTVRMRGSHSSDFIDRIEAPETPLVLQGPKDANAISGCQTAPRGCRSPMFRFASVIELRDKPGEIFSREREVPGSRR